MPVLQCTHLTKRFHETNVVNGVSLTAQAGEIVTLLGPSGCGKTTTLRLIAGFEWPDEGTISIQGRVVAGGNVRVPPEERRIGMVFQDYALFPHLDVAGNVAFGLKGNRREKERRVGDMLALVGLAGLEKRMPYALSGGQQQRVALARALAPQPEVLLLDEPFSNLDAALRAQVRFEVRSILKAAGITCIFVTHDQQEALSLSDQVAVMFEGRIAQFGSPHDLYSRPISRDVAQFLGEANFLSATAHGNDATSSLGTVPLTRPASGLVDLLLRPEMLRLNNPAVPNATVEWTEYYGHDQRVGLRLKDGQSLVARVAFDRLYGIGQPVHVSIQGAAVAFERATRTN
ncbi:MAG: ABC transporter ATP-binding protein [bacterium]|nr:ABC transporter ATP-binding protein [bacterium]